MGILDKLLIKGNHAAESIAQKTILVLKNVEVKDRAPLSNELDKLFRRESLMDRLEFSRPTCVIKYLSKRDLSKDTTLSAALQS